MNARAQCLFLVCLLIAFASCHDAVKTRLEVVIFQPEASTPPATFPPTLKEIVLPFQGIGDEEKDFIFHPIEIKRADLSKSTELRYMKRDGRMDRIKSVLRQLENYFQDSIPPSLLSLPGNSNIDTAKWITRLDTDVVGLVYSNDENLVIRGTEIIYSMSDLREAMAQQLLEGGTKITVYLDPQPLKRFVAPLPPPPPPPPPPIPAEKFAYFCGSEFTDTTMYFVIDNHYCASREAVARLKERVGKIRVRATDVRFKPKLAQDGLFYYITIGQTRSFEEAVEIRDKYLPKRDEINTALVVPKRQRGSVRIGHLRSNGERRMMYYYTDDSRLEEKPFTASECDGVMVTDSCTLERLSRQVGLLR